MFYVKLLILLVLSYSLNSFAEDSLFSDQDILTPNSDENGISSHPKKNYIHELEGVYIPVEVPFYDAKGATHYLEDKEGKVLLVVFWASWCSNCIEQLKSLDLLKKDFKKLPFDVILISEDYDGLDRTKEYFTEHELRYLEPYHDARQQMFEAFGVNNLPTAFLVGENSQQLLRFNGRINWFDDNIRKQILAFIPGDYNSPRNSYDKNSLSIPVTKNLRAKNPKSQPDIQPRRSNLSPEKKL